MLLYFFNVISLHVFMYINAWKAIFPLAFFPKYFRTNESRTSATFQHKPLCILWSRCTLTCLITLFLYLFSTIFCSNMPTMWVVFSALFFRRKNTKQIKEVFNIYANNYAKILKEARANSQCNDFTIQHPIDGNEKACIFDSRNKTIKTLVWRIALLSGLPKRITGVW